MTTTSERLNEASNSLSADYRRYRILGVLGHGGFGTVYHARMEGSDGFVKEVAIKLLSDPNPSPEILGRFRDEARILGRLRDRAIVSVDPPTRLHGRWAVVMEFVDGMDCRAALRRYRRLPPVVALGIVEEVARTLHNLWNHPGEDGAPMRLLHRDIKPSNIQLTPNGDVKVLDFGIARADFDTREATTSSHISGSHGYIAPERLEGVEDHRGDVYSLGVVLEELVTGLRPQLLGASTGSAPPHAALSVEIPEEILELARSMRRGNPGDRPSAEQVERRCSELIRELPQKYPHAGPSLRDWARTYVPRGLPEASPQHGPRDELVGQTLSHTLPRMSFDSGPPVQVASRRDWSLLTAALLMVMVGVALLIVVIGAGSLSAFYLLNKNVEPVAVQDPLPVIAPPVPAPPAPVVAVPAEPAPVEPATGGPGAGADPGKAPPPEPSKPPVRGGNTGSKKPKPPKPKPPTASTGLVSQSGADAIELVGDAGRFSTGRVPAGRYAIYATFSGAAAVPAGTVEVGAGASVSLRCDARFKRCMPQ